MGGREGQPRDSQGKRGTKLMNHVGECGTHTPKIGSYRLLTDSGICFGHPIVLKAHQPSYHVPHPRSFSTCHPAPAPCGLSPREQAFPHWHQKMAEATQASLLQWSVLHAENSYQQQQQHQQIDSKWVDVILGKKDAVKMKESVNVVVDESRTLDDRVAAFDQLEMLIESGDNARDLRPLDLWKPVLYLLASDTAHPRLRFYAAWVVGTAVQNDQTVQTDFLDVGGLDVLIPAIKSESDTQVLAKIIYALSKITPVHSPPCSLTPASHPSAPSFPRNPRHRHTHHMTSPTHHLQTTPT
ncbi:nucleotide exchange factor Fes1-domain-containing protein [Cladochytrium replicatum]|nr:nucleotide exchange factor Fes1-domain-containing protein [Cladochytrium replicatum]